MCGHGEGYELTDGWHGNKVSSEPTEILHPTPGRQDFSADSLENADTQMEMQTTMIMFGDYPAVIRTLRFLSATIVAKVILP